MNLLYFCYVLISLPIGLLASSGKLAENEVKHQKSSTNELITELLKLVAGNDDQIFRNGRSAMDLLENLPDTLTENKSDILTEELQSESAHEQSHTSTVEKTMLVGSVRGIPGEHFPDYTDIPISSFSCDDKTTPGFYADIETGCQVFHVCYDQKRESFLCPVGTTFHQEILTCDMWYNSNCSTSSNFYYVNKNEESDQELVEEAASITSSDNMNVTTLVQTGEELTIKKESSKNKDNLPKLPSLTAEEFWEHFMKFFPVKAKVVVYPGEHSHGKIIAEASVGDKQKNLHPPTHGPATHKPVHPTTHRPTYSTTRRPVYPSTHKPVYPSSHRPTYSTTHRTNYPTTHRPVYPSTRKPVYPTTHSPVYPTTRRPDYTTTRRPVYPTTHRPVYPTTHRPVYPTTHRPVYPTTQRPVYPTTHRPAHPTKCRHPTKRRPIHPKPSPSKPHPRPGTHIDPKVKKTIEDALNIARKILEQVAEMIPHQPEECCQFKSKTSLTQINPRFNFKGRMN